MGYWSEWIEKWSGEYPAYWDAKVAPLRGKSAFYRDDVAAVFRWKFRRMWPEKKVRNMHSLAEERALDMSNRAVSCADELGTQTILTLIQRHMPQEEARFYMWPEYLTTCRQLAVQARFPLRTVNRALWAANGRM